MELVSRFFGKRSQKSDKRKISRLQAASLEQSRRELIAMALRDTLRKHGLPAGCVTVEGLPGSEVGGQRGLHLQFVFRDWQSSLLLSYVAALETSVGARLARLDPLSPSWVTGISWRFEPADRRLWPQLPAAGPRGTGADRSTAVVRGDSRAAFEWILQSREEDSRARAAANTNFTPTLPMDGK